LDIIKEGEIMTKINNEEDHKLIEAYTWGVVYEETRKSSKGK